MIGSIIHDRYKIEARIGRGGFATVYRALDMKLKRPVAIKFLDQVGDSERFKARFLREAESMARFSHPNIVTVYDCAESGARSYLVMEFVNGPTLGELAETVTLTLAEICTNALQVCQAMSYAHKHGVIHRDLTLRNIMIDEHEGEQPQIKIMDFGIAKLIHEQSHTTSRHLLGTPYYMAPEQIQNETINTRADIFAFGVGLFRLLNGRFPFEAEHPAALMYLILNESKMEWSENIPTRMKNLVIACLEKDPHERISSFDDLIPELKAIRSECAEAESASTSSTSGLSVHVERSGKRNPYLNRVMIKRPSEFFGRAREIRRIYSRLDAPRPQSISIVGERRIGKSSLLNYVYQLRNRRAHMRNHENTIFVYLDFQSEVEFDVTKFIDFLFNMFSYERMDGHDYRSRTKSLDELRDVVRELNEEGKRIVVLMDEFETITRDEHFDASFFSFLRSLANSFSVAYVTSSYDDLQNMCHNQDISDSPFFNIFSNLPLRPFIREEALELITVLSEREGVPLERHAEKILDMAGCFPLFLQIACSNVFEYLTDNPEADPDWPEIAASFMEEVHQHYRFVWERFKEPSRDNIARIAMGKPISKKYGFVNEELERRGYLVPSGEGFKLFSSSFEEFVVEQQKRGAGGRRGLLGFLPRKKG